MGQMGTKQRKWVGKKSAGNGLKKRKGFHFNTIDKTEEERGGDPSVSENKVKRDGKRYLEFSSSEKIE